MRFSILSAQLSNRGKLLAFMNIVFFGSFFAFVVLADIMLYPSLYSEVKLPFSELFPSNIIYLVILSIFLSNLLYSAFAIVTLPGFVFFPLSAGFLLFRSFIWGVLFSQQPSLIFLLAVPTLVIEGEAYCIAAVCGTVVGASWIRPKLVYGAEDLARVESLKRSLKECIGLYIWVILLLFIAAIIETLTLVIISK